MGRSLSELFTYGYQREPKIRNAIYAFILSGLYFLVIGIPFLFGYMLQIIRNISRNENTKNPPTFRPLYSMFRDGLIVLVYAIVFLGIPGSGIFSAIFLTDNNLNAGTLNTTEVALVNGTLSGLFVILICGTFLLPASLSLVVLKDDWKAGFKFNTIRSVIYNGKYFKMYVYFMIVSLIFGTLARVLFSVVVAAPFAVIVWYIYITSVGQIFGDYAREIKKKDLDSM